MKAVSILLRRVAPAFHSRSGNHAGAELKTRATAVPRLVAGKENGKKMKIEIYSTVGDSLYSGEHENLAAAVSAAVRAGADLTGAKLTEADIEGAIGL